jgi:hypothetical protein
VSERERERESVCVCVRVCVRQKSAQVKVLLIHPDKPLSHRHHQCTIRAPTERCQSTIRAPRGREGSSPAPALLPAAAEVGARLAAIDGGATRLAAIDGAAWLPRADSAPEALGRSWAERAEPRVVEGAREPSRRRPCMGRDGEERGRLRGS